MNDHKPRLALFPGTFDPMTNGHLDVIRRAVELFDELVVGVGNNPDKTCLLEHSVRADVVREVVADIAGVRVESYEGLTVDFARSVGAAVIVRGLRNTTDLHFEFEVAMSNRAVTGIETVFILASPECGFVSSGLIKQLAQQGADVSVMVPAAVLWHLPGGPGRTAGTAAPDQAP